ncbi:MAG: hypothetical protein AAFZ91_14750 [Pseudomonadota bacterium]
MTRASNHRLKWAGPALGVAGIALATYITWHSSREPTQEEMWDMQAEVCDSILKRQDTTIADIRRLHVNDTRSFEAFIQEDICPLERAKYPKEVEQKGIDSAEECRADPLAFIAKTDRSIQTVERVCRPGTAQSTRAAFDKLASDFPEINDAVESVRQ